MRDGPVLWDEVQALQTAALVELQAPSTAHASLSLHQQRSTAPHHHLPAAGLG
jgi:hypothetical protein